MKVIHADMAPHAEQLDAASKALLPVMRHFLNAYLHPETLGWRTGFATATGTWGEARGLAIANAVQTFLSAVLLNRPVPLRYNDPLDVDARKHLTTDEVELLALIAAMRADKTDHARTIIARLTGGSVKAAIVRTGLSLATILDPTAARPARTKRPVLRAVT
ncbi:MAG: hypothetical protein AAF801_11775 [Pseudomonadota bacterium]